MKFEFNTNTIIGAAILIFLFVQFMCGKPKEQTITTSHSDTTTINKDSTFHSHEQRDFNYHYAETLVYVPKLDSEQLAEIAKAFFRIKVYNDTIRDTSAQVEVVILDTITQNSISYRKTWLKNLRPTTQIVNTTIVKPIPKIRLYVGATLNYDHSKISVLPSAILQNRKEDLLYINYEPTEKIYGVGFHKKISFRK